MEAWQPWAVGAAVATLLALRLWSARAFRRWKLSARRARAAAGEREAEALLVGAGYAIEARQAEATLRYRLDEEPVDVRVRVDLIVRRRGRRYLAETKTGAVAPRLASRATRRQLLEYAHAFDVDGLLLVDADRRRIQRVCVPARGHAARAWPLALTALLLGAIVGALLMRAAG